MWRNLETDLVPSLGFLMFGEQVAQISEHQLALFQANERENSKLISGYRWVSSR